MSNFKRMVAGLGLCLVASLGWSAGPTTELYFCDGGSLERLQGTSLSSSLLNFPDEVAPIVTASGVTTLGSQAGEFGSYYSLGGITQAGITVNMTGSTLQDATTDQAYNYFLDASGNLVQTHLDFSSPMALFNVGSAFASGGVGYDAVNDSFWVTANGQVEDVSRTDGVVTSFQTDVTTNSIAFDPKDHTLWLADANNPTLYQFSQEGAELSTDNLGLSGPVQGMSFGQPQATPEPATLGALLIGALGLVRKKRTAHKNRFPSPSEVSQL